MMIRVVLFLLGDHDPFGKSMCMVTLLDRYYQVTGMILHFILVYFPDHTSWTAKTAYGQAFSDVAA